MKQCVLGLILALAAPLALSGCATERHSAIFGNYKVVYRQLGPVAQRWETVKAAVTGWEVIGATDDEEYSLLLLHKNK